MAKLVGPLGSKFAAGSIDHALIFSRTGHIPYAKRHRKPNNPRTQFQTGHRSAVAFLTREWSNLTTTQQESWRELAEEFDLPNYQSFLKANLGLWPRFIAPIKHADNPGEDTDGFLSSINTYYETNQVVLRANVIPKNDCWGVIFCMDYSGYPTQQVQRTVAMSPVNQYGWSFYIHRNMAPGIYYYSFAHFTHRGTMTVSDKLRRIILPH